MPYQLGSIEEQKEYERQRIEEAKAAKAGSYNGSTPAFEAVSEGSIPSPATKLDVSISELLDGKDLCQVARDNNFWKDSYSRLGPGQLRMTIGNVLRGRLKKKLPIIINGEQIGTSS